VTDIVVVPVWQRAGFTEACLVRLSMAMDDDVRVIVAVDCGYSEGSMQAARRFAYAFEDQTVIAVRDVDYPTGSYNVFTGMREALEKAAEGDLIHVLEEDILVGRDYFAYHRQARRLVPDAYSISACENIFLPDHVRLPSWHDSVYLSGAFQVWGSSYTPQRVEGILTRLRPNYFPEMHAAMVEEFGEENALRTGPLYDGVMANDIAQSGSYMAFPYAPRAYHAGFEGVSYGGSGLPSLTGTPRQQARAILGMSEAELTARSTLPGARFRTVDLDGRREGITKIVPY